MGSWSDWNVSVHDSMVSLNLTPDDAPGLCVEFDPMNAETLGRALEAAAREAMS